jgi:hypothetical protein
MDLLLLLYWRWPPPRGKPNTERSFLLQNTSSIDIRDERLYIYIYIRERERERDYKQNFTETKQSMISTHQKRLPDMSFDHRICNPHAEHISTLSSDAYTDTHNQWVFKGFANGGHQLLVSHQEQKQGRRLVSEEEEEEEEEHGMDAGLRALARQHPGLEEPSHHDEAKCTAGIHLQDSSESSQEKQERKKGKRCQCNTSFLSSRGYVLIWIWTKGLLSISR